MSVANGTKLTVAIDDLPGVVGEAFGPSSWRAISQPEVDQFADLTDDHNPIHIDPVAAAATSFGTTIVHGFFTLSLVAPLLADVLEVTEYGVGINYGLNKVRFPAPVPVGSRIRVSGTIGSVTEIPGGYQVEPIVTIEVEGGTKPVCVAELAMRYYK